MTGLTEYSGVALARAIRQRAVSAREVVEAHLEQLTSRPWLNAVVVDRSAEARAEADAVDARIRAAAPDETLPPYLGVPCTIKGSIAVAGLPHTGGEVRRAGVRPAESAPGAARLLGTGAILLGLTNTPEMSLHWETANRLHGRTSNAHDPRRNAGGSSGGEGAAIGAGASVFGLGTDIGGSIRIPAAHNGVFGHMPSRGLVPRTGHHLTPTGSAAAFLRMGPLARQAEDLMPLLRALAGPDPSDPLTRPVALGDPADVELAGLPVVVSEDMSYMPLRREMRAARDRAATALAAAGAKVSAVSLRSLRHATTAYLVAFNEGFGTPLAELLAGARDTTLPIRLALLQERAHKLRPHRQVDRLLSLGSDLVDELESAVGEGVLLHPSFPRRAPRHQRTLAQPWLIGGLAAWNMTGLPATQVPLGLGFNGLPIGVQVLTGQNRDHVGIRVALELERAFGGWVPPRHPSSRAR